MGIVATAVKSTEKFLKPITESWKGLGGRQKAGVVGGGAALISGGALAARALSGNKNNTTINKISEFTTSAILDKLASKKKTHPVSEHQRRWAFAAEERGKLPKGKAYKWSKRVKGEHLPAKTSSDDVANAAFMDELNKLASEKGLKKLIKKIHKTHPEAFAGVAK
jgi:flagellar biosynthesis/type III secretory pathway M-ring protein FliF/YscJ